MAKTKQTFNMFEEDEVKQAAVEQPEVKEQAQEEGKKDKGAAAEKRQYVNLNVTGLKSYLSIMSDVKGMTVTGYIRWLIEQDAQKPENIAVYEAIKAFKEGKK